MAEEGSTEQIKKDLADLELLKPRLEREMLEDGAAHPRPGPNTYRIAAYDECVREMRLIASCLLLVATAAAQETPTVELNGGMQGQLLSLGRQGYGLTAAVKIANKAQDHVFVLLFGAPSAVDDAGVRFDVMQAINGVAFCRGPAINQIG